MGKNRYYTRYNGTIYNLSKIQDILDGKANEDITMTLAHDYGIEPLEALLIEDVINFKNREIPADMNEAIKEYQDFNVAQREARQVHCPRCGSTNVEKREFLPLPWASYQKYWYCNNCHSRFDV